MFLWNYQCRWNRFYKNVRSGVVVTDYRIETEVVGRWTSTMEESMRGKRRVISL